MPSPLPNLRTGSYLAEQIRVLSLLRDAAVYFSADPFRLYPDLVIGGRRDFGHGRAFKIIDTGRMQRRKPDETSPPAIMMNPLAHILLWKFRFGRQCEFGAQFLSKLPKPEFGLRRSQKLCEFGQRVWVDQRMGIGYVFRRKQRVFTRPRSIGSFGRSFHDLGVPQIL